MVAKDFKELALDLGNNEKSIERLAQEIHVEDYIGLFNVVKDDSDKTIFGLNVRLDDDSSIIPFMAHRNVKGYDGQAIAKRVEKDYNFPSFVSKYGIEQILLWGSFVDGKLETEISFIQHSSDATNAEVIEFLQYPKSFLYQNLMAMNLGSDEKFAVILKTYDISIKNPSSTLSNFLVISTSWSILGLFGGEIGMRPTQEYDALYYATNKNTLCDIELQIRSFLAVVRSRRELDLREQSKREAIKSAKAAIMSRNMSHNLGSHVMAYLKQHLSSVKDMLRDKILTQFFEDENDLRFLLEDPTGYSRALIERIKQSIQSDNKEAEAAQTDGNAENSQEETEVERSSNDGVINSIALPFLVGLGQFISYLQERQDFIATIATDYVPYFSTVNFKDFIYDELNNDKRYARHPDRQNLKPDNILLGNIARSEGLGRTTSPTYSLSEKSSLHDIVLKFRTTFNGDPVEPIEKPLVNPLDYYSPNELPKAKQELEEMRGYDVSLPGGIVGRQAFFSIIENIIRNAAKHGNWREKGKLEISIDIFSKADITNTNPTQSLQERLRDDRWSKESLSLKEVFEKYYINDKDKGNDLFFVTITDNLSISTDVDAASIGKAPKSISLLRKALIDDYIDEDNRMKNSNKGIKEMRISAAWLRSIVEDKKDYVYDSDSFDIEDGKWGDSKGDVPPVLYARISKDKDGDCHLQYIFCLVRPQKVAFVSSSFDCVDMQIDKDLRDGFWRTLTPNAYEMFNNKSFDIVVYDDLKEKALLDTLEGHQDISSQHHLFRLVSERNKVRCMSPNRFVCLSELKGSPVWSLYNIIIGGDTNYEGIDTLLDKAEVSLYQHLARWDGKEKILIFDERAWSHYNTGLKTEEKTKIKGKITFDQNEPGSKYRYITHLEDKEQFFHHIIQDSERDCFISSEGITGNNSTDRLIRNEKMTELWFYKHLRALKYKIGIFDERIFSKAFGLEEPDLSIDFDQVEPYASAVKGFDEEEKSVYCQCYGVSPLFDRESISAKNYLGATYAYKSVFVFSLVRSNEHKDEFNLYGYKQDATNNNSFAQCVKYATLSWNKEQEKLILQPCGNHDHRILHGFDFLSIHQGLLDKLYGLFNIKNNVQARENLTRDFYTFFVGDGKAFEIPDDSFNCKKQIKTTHYFLPGMTIHSGRSKPGVNDMPQRLPFIPFSAIEHAVFDCKYSLIELLDSARYE